MDPDELYPGSFERDPDLAPALPPSPPRMFLLEDRAALAMSHQQRLGARRARQQLQQNYQQQLQPRQPSSSRLQDSSPDESRQSKRQRLESLTPFHHAFTRFDYGRLGQVEPGPLRMEVQSCDGGMYTGASSSFAVESILADNSDVYCTKGSRCNIVLRHLGGSIFTMTELIIKAPASAHYSSPLRDGLVFVSMDRDHLLARTAKYMIQYVSIMQLTTSVWGASDEQRHGIRTIGPDLLAQWLDPPTDQDWLINGRTRYRDPDVKTAQMPAEFVTTTTATHPVGQCFYEHDDTAADIESAYTERANTESADPDLISADEPARNRAGPVPAEGGHRPLRSNSYPQNGLDKLCQIHEGHEPLMTPHARFHMTRSESTCIIRFDPPVSGRFLLLKLFNPQEERVPNIDIQSVIVKGFAGQRQFDSVEWR